VLVDIGAVDEAEKHGANERGKNRLNLPWNSGIVMIPNLRSRREMVFRFGHDDRGVHLRAEYSKEIDDYLLSMGTSQFPIMPRSYDFSASFGVLSALGYTVDTE
jgi:hypothetical protein